ncbi:MAG: DNRLRE domain-containing protein [Clostridiales bacterium]|nr:DNRLRE domain-containing protein [Clostridiales bacterium]
MAADADGLIVNVEFYEGAVKLGEDASAPYAFAWTGVTPGDHTITAVATDNDGGMQTSAAVTFTALPITDLVFQDGLNGYAGTRDTYIRSDSAAQGTSYGSDADISIDGDDGSPGSAPNQGLIRFDDIFGEGLYQIPVGSTITNATLTLTVFDPGSGMTVHRMLVDWLESSTWNSLVGGVQTDDVEAGSAALVSIGANDGNTNVAVGELNLDVTTAVQAWYAIREDFVLPVERLSAPGVPVLAGEILAGARDAIWIEPDRLIAAWPVAADENLADAVAAAVVDLAPTVSLATVPADEANQLLNEWLTTEAAAAWQALQQPDCQYLILEFGGT